MRFALPLVNDTDEDDVMPELAISNNSLDEYPEFFPDVWVWCGYNIVFRLLD